MQSTGTVTDQISRRWTGPREAVLRHGPGGSFQAARPHKAQTPANLQRAEGGRRART